MSEYHHTAGSWGGVTRVDARWGFSLRALLWVVGQQARQMKDAIAALLDYEPPARDWAAHVTKPIETRKNAPDWIRERNEVLNRSPLVRIHAECFGFDTNEKRRGSAVLLRPLGVG